ncbi:hypothetical protein LEP1GSC074_1370 [Leptospira noguchii str. Hook]|nr:hypothetical protein LEP1GSC074_1370 [Leptospira noguchii str. Hook]EMS87241.1 hypothetical protein LEP1GSC073_0490 [Leptospira noguchii str. Cascata]
MSQNFQKLKNLTQSIEKNFIKGTSIKTKGLIVLKSKLV